MLTKIMGSLLIILSGFLIGVQYLKKLNTRNKSIAFFIKILKEMNILIEYTHSTIPQILKQCIDLKNDKFLRECVEKINYGESLKEAWETTVKDSSDEMCLGEEEIKILTDFASCLGETDVYGQISNIKFYIERLENRLCDLNKQTKEKGKVTMSCCIFSGIIIVILLL